MKLRRRIMNEARCTRTKRTARRTMRMTRSMACNPPGGRVATPFCGRLVVVPSGPAPYKASDVPIVDILRKRINYRELRTNLRFRVASAFAMDDEKTYDEAKIYAVQHDARKWCTAGIGRIRPLGASPGRIGPHTTVRFRHFTGSVPSSESARRSRILLPSSIV